MHAHMRIWPTQTHTTLMLWLIAKGEYSLNSIWYSESWSCAHWAPVLKNLLGPSAESPFTLCWPPSAGALTLFGLLPKQQGFCIQSIGAIFIQVHFNVLYMGMSLTTTSSFKVTTFLSFYFRHLEMIHVLFGMQKSYLDSRLGKKMSKKQTH